MIDTHCHLTSDQYGDHVDAGVGGAAAGGADGGVEGVIARARAAGLRGLITISVTAEDGVAALRLAETHEDVWCTAGVHPLYADKPLDWEQVRRTATHPRCVAWGELGLDNHYEKPPRELQDRVLEEQLRRIESAVQDGLAMPVVVHCRDAFDELLAVFRSSSLDPARYVFHCFTGDADEARRVLDFGAWISITGVVTFKNAKDVAEAAKLIPSDRIMVETDAPYLTPEPMRKVWPNEPQFVVHTARFLAELRGVDPVEFEHELDANAERFFGITLAEGG